MTHFSISATSWCKILLFPEWPTSASDPPQSGLLSCCISQLFWVCMLLRFPEKHHKIDKKVKAWWTQLSWQRKHIRLSLATMDLNSLATSFIKKVWFQIKINWEVQYTFILLVWLIQKAHIGIPTDTSENNGSKSFIADSAKCFLCRRSDLLVSNTF